MENSKKKYQRIQTIYHGGACIHNLECWVCKKNPAVYNMHPNWVFEPCWDCQEKIGGKVYRVKNRFIKWLLN